MDFSCLDLWISVGSWEQFLLHGFRAVSGWSTGHNWAPPAATCPGRFGVSWRKHRGTKMNFLQLYLGFQMASICWKVAARVVGLSCDSLLSFWGISIWWNLKWPICGPMSIHIPVSNIPLQRKVRFRPESSLQFSVSGASKSRPRKATAGGWTWEIEKCLMLCQWLGTRSISWRQIGVL